jgi:lipopolysaccharide export system protein LptC
MAVVTATADPARERLYARLSRRNRLVTLLRVAVPVAGAVILAVVVGGIVVDNLREQFGFSSIRIDRDNLVVDTPKLTATGDDGTLYSATARVAKVRVGGTDVIDMTDAVFTMTPLEGAAFTALSPLATLQTKTQIITVPGTMSVTSNDGLHGTITDFTGDVPTWQIVANGAVDLTFPEGMHVQSQGMTYDGNKKLWSFSRATVTLPETPGGAVETAPPTMELAP